MFGFVFQFGQLVPELPAVENIALPLMLAGRRRRHALAAAAPWPHDWAWTASASGSLSGELPQIVLLETAAAMLVTAAVGVGLGMAVSYAFALFGNVAWTWPDAGVFAMAGTGVLAALVLSALALPLLDAATRHDAVRYE